MILHPRDLALVGALANGLPLSETPYADLGRAIGMDGAEVMARLKAMQEGGVIRRLGVIVRHHELGYRANAMVVWNIPDDQVSDVGRRLADCPDVTLCYRRPRRLPHWPYNLFSMVHGRDRQVVEECVATLARTLDLDGFDRQLLFSLRRFKQKGAAYGGCPAKVA